ncbi:MAG: hypothetical protein ABI697_12750 [Devosia sp.]
MPDTSDTIQIDAITALLHRHAGKHFTLTVVSADWGWDVHVVDHDQLELKSSESRPAPKRATRRRAAP